MTLDRGKPIPISTATRVVIGPLDTVIENFSSAKDTKEALLKSLDPVQLGIKTKRINLTANNSVVLIADDINVEALRTNAALSAAGLEVKPDEKLNPRIIVHDIPVEYEAAEIIRSILDLNLTSFSTEDVKMVFMYPARDKKHRSCIIEIKPECRKMLENTLRLQISWHSCQFADHISILQCYKCLQFGHKAVDCKGSFRCGHCAAEHDTATCTNKKNLCCFNCRSAKAQLTSHSAFDKSKCTLLRNKIERKTHRIDYGA